MKIIEEKNYLNFKFFIVFGDQVFIHRIEIPSCRAEPCVLKHGTPLPAKITFNAGMNENLKDFEKYFSKKIIF
jgi:hypothetical protein